MALLFSAAFLYAIIALGMSLRAFWCDIGDPVAPGNGSLWQAIRDAATLRYLDGGGIGCYNHDERPNDRRAFYHHMTFYGFGLCFASTSVATLYHYFLAREAPYPWWDLPVVLGTLGGIGLIFGPLGLIIAKLRRDPVMVDEVRLGMDFAFIAMLFATSLTGLALLVLRNSTERPEAIEAGFARRLVPGPELSRLLRDAIAEEDWLPSLAAKSSPYGDGTTSARIVRAIEGFLQ